MLVLIEHKIKNTRFFWVLSDRTNRRLLSIVKKNVFTKELEYDNVPEINSTKTRIYFDCFKTCQINDFKNMGFYLKRTNYPTLFCYGLFHTNMVESIWNNIKKLQ